MPFKLTERAERDEEQSLQSVQPIMIPVSRQVSQSGESVYSSFYGRRDFENKHDDSSDLNTAKLGNPSNLDNVLIRIRSLRDSYNSESENEDDFCEDDDNEM